MSDYQIFSGPILGIGWQVSLRWQLMLLAVSVDFHYSYSGRNLQRCCNSLIINEQTLLA